MREKSDEYSGGGWLSPVITIVSNEQGLPGVLFTGYRLARTLPTGRQLLSDTHFGRASPMHM